MRTSLKGHPVRSTFLQIYLSTQIEIFLAALMFYESCGKAAAIEGSEHATDTCTYVHTPPTVVGELVSAMADECGQPDRSMMHSRLISRCNFLFPALLRISPLPPTSSRQSPSSPTPLRHGTRATCWQTVVAPRCDCAMPRTAMEQSGHAQVPTLLVALVRRQARRAGWRGEIAYKNTEE